MKTSTVLDTIAKQCTISYYAYDAFGRRTLVKDEGGSTMRTLYDAQSFEQIRSGPSFNDESFTSNYSRGALTQGNGSGERYRFIEDGNTDGRYRYTGDDDIAVVAKRYTGVQVPLVAGGTEVAMNRAGSTLAGATTRGGVSYLGNDVLGSMRSATNESGSLEEVFEYDAFGTPVSGDFNTGLNAGYTGKPYDSVTGLYDYGYRDYSPQLVRFTTVDPIRDGSNWFAYVNNDPVNFIDPTGLTASDKKNVQVTVTYTGTNPRGAATGTMTATDGNKTVSVPIVSGANEKGNVAAPLGPGSYPNVPTVPSAQSPTAAKTLTDDKHGGKDSTYQPIPGTDGRAIHQGNNGANQSSAYSAGCVAVTTIDKTKPQQNQEAYNALVNGRPADITVIDNR